MLCVSPRIRNYYIPGRINLRDPWDCNVIPPVAYGGGGRSERREGVRAINNPGEGVGAARCALLFAHYRVCSTTVTKAHWRDGVGVYG